MIVFDTETTGLITNIALPLAQQPHIIEFCAIKLDDESLEERGLITFFAKPPVELPQIVQDITHITPAMLKDEKPFRAYMADLAEFFLGERRMVAHNCSYDRDMLHLELRRAGWDTKFPWPSQHTCTVEATHGLKGHRLNLTKMYTELFGEAFPEAHRAESDVRALVRCVRELKSRELI